MDPQRKGFAYSSQGDNLFLSGTRSSWSVWSSYLQVLGCLRVAVLTTRLYLHFTCNLYTKWFRVVGQTVFGTATPLCFDFISIFENVLHGSPPVLFFLVKMKSARDNHFLPFFRFFSRAQIFFHAYFFHFFKGYYYFSQVTREIFHGQENLYFSSGKSIFPINWRFGVQSFVFLKIFTSRL